MGASQQGGGSNWNKPVFGINLFWDKPVWGIMRRRACRYTREKIMMQEVENNDLQDMFLHEGVKTMT